MSAVVTAPSTERIEWVSEATRFAELGADWERLSEAQPVPFLSHAWLSAWWRAFGAGRELSVCALWRDDRLAAAFPLYRLGNRLSAMANVETPVYGPLAEDKEALAAVTATVAAAAPALTVTALPADGDALDGLRRASANANRVVLLERAHTSPIVETTGEWADYRQRTKPLWGAPLERFRRKMQREHAATFVVVEQPRELERQLQDGFELEASGWKGQSGTAILSSADTTGFYRSIARSFAPDMLRLSGLYLDGALAAFDLSILHRNRLYLLKTGFDERHRRLAPGLVMRLSILERCFELGLDAHELLGGAEEWKLKFATAARQHRTFRSYRRRPLPLLRYGYRLARPMLKQANARVGKPFHGQRW